MKYEISDYDAKMEQILYASTVMLTVMNLYYYGIEFMYKQNLLIMAAVVFILSKASRLHKKSDKLDKKGRMKDKDIVYMLIYVFVLVVLLGLKMILRKPDNVVIITICFFLFLITEIFCWVNHKKHFAKSDK